MTGHGGGKSSSGGASAAERTVIEREAKAAEAGSEGARLFKAFFGRESPEPFTGTELEELDKLFGPGKRAERRAWLLVRAVRFFKSDDTVGEDACFAFLGKSTARIRSICDFAAGWWGEHHRQKTCVDGLSRDDQNVWSEKSRAYKETVRRSTRVVQEAQAVYKRVLSEEMHKQEVEREKLREWLKSKGAQDAPLLDVPDELDEIDALREELKAAGLTVPDAVENRARELAENA